MLVSLDHISNHHRYHKSYQSSSSLSSQLVFKLVFNTWKNLFSLCRAQSSVFHFLKVYLSQVFRVFLYFSLSTCVLSVPKDFLAISNFDI